MVVMVAEVLTLWKTLTINILAMVAVEVQAVQMPKALILIMAVVAVVLMAVVVAVVVITTMVQARLIPTSLVGLQVLAQYELSGVLDVHSPQLIQVICKEKSWQ
jgi:hypothetical protein